jgi:thioredoxin-dependent peroxiredoxin
MVKLNEQAPDFCLKNQNEESVCLKDFKGKWVVLYFYPKDNTPGCTMEAIYFTKYQKEFQQLNTVILGISTDSCESHKKFADKNNLSLILLSDPDHAVSESYGVWSPKSFMGRSFLGISRTTFLINPQGNLVHSWPKVKVAGHTTEVLNKLKEVQKVK